jgi:sugar lactone lactonase YvrE
MKAEQITAPLCEHGEGAAFSERWDGPRWVDMLAGDLLQLGSDGEVRRRHVGEIAAMTRPRADGGWMVATERSIAWTAEDDFDAPLHHGPELWDDPGVRSNEGACAPDGRLYLGTMDYAATPARGFVMELPVQRDPRIVVASVTISNGLGFAPDGASAYYVDSPLRRIDRFDWDPHAGLHDRRPWVRLADDVEGIPDGLAVDAEGGVWVAMFGGSSVRRFGTDGQEDAVIELPVRQPTSVAFVRCSLLITTSRYGVGHAAEPAAGALFAVPELPVSGAPIAPFGG